MIVNQMQPIICEIVYKMLGLTTIRNTSVQVKLIGSIIVLLFLSLPYPLFAQGNNTGYGDDNTKPFTSIAERILKIEKKQDVFNVFLNFSYAGEIGLGNINNITRFKCKQFRLEIKGNITDRLYYRFRHRLNKASNSADDDNFAKVTDYMMVGYRLNDKWSLQAGKMCQFWGGFEFDANPMYIYQYSDMVDNIDSSKAGLAVLFKPVQSHELVLEVSNARNEKLETSYPGIKAQRGRDAKVPFAYLINWNGNFSKNKLQTRWSLGLRTLAKSTYSYQMILGQCLNLSKFKCYVDYSYEADDIDRMAVITNEANSLLPADKSLFEKVGYHSIVVKADWQFFHQWNAYVQGMFETASVRKGFVNLKGYRKHYSYLTGIEYYPVKSQDLHFSLSYIGQSFCFSDKSGLSGHNESRIELGMMYRIKCF